MNLFYIGCVAIILSFIPTTVALSASCEEDWTINWDQEPPDFSTFQLFSSPGEILPNITVTDILQFVGVLWSAPSWQEITGRLCVQVGPMIHAFYPMEQFRRECDVLVTSLQKDEKPDIYKVCNSLWDQLEVENTTKKLANDLLPCLAEDIPRYLRVVCDVDPLRSIYAESFLERASRLAFDMLKWLGPSPFSGDFYGACSAGRILLSGDIDHIADELKNLLTYLVADTLVYMKFTDICKGEGGQFQDFLYYLPSTMHDEESICDFLSQDHSQQEYLEKGSSLIDTFLNVFVDTDLCIDVVTFITLRDPSGAASYEITGMNLTYEINRSSFCREMTSAFSDNSQYTPTPYSFPDDQNITAFNLYDKDGHPLPNFSFMDAMNVLAAFFKSNTLLDGSILLCDVFESFLSEFKPSFARICPLLRSKDTEELEKICLQMSLPADYHPSLRIPTMIYMAVTTVDVARRYLTLTEISQDQFCLALDDFFSSKNNLQSFAQLGVDVYLAELLPIADKICKDYEAAVEFLANLSSLPSNEFNEYIQAFSDFILTHLGFSDRLKFCQTTAAGIDTSSGRTESSLVKDMQEQFLLFLTSSDRCTKSLKSVEKIFEIVSSQDDFPDILNTYTGYNSTTSLCEDVSTFFDPALCMDPETNKPHSAATLTGEFNGFLVALALLMAYLRLVL
ncbi:hypothetical protein HOLleu_18305 [Holothuria leucospilota]|uniref:Uncharacterized protein n=1 Tax=Holothuria leucospilota TaxID=206669 RepID=A0A9Q1C2Z5_HOLLE|nr:hypothetical protein HOLleu_18305 [Holothuria leucospilota]